MAAAREAGDTAANVSHPPRDAARFTPKDLIISFFPSVRQMKRERDGSAVPNLIIYLLNRLQCYSPRAVVTDGCWEVKWAKCFVRMLPLTKPMQHCSGNLCQIQIRHISFK